jgi:hypothetical protein
MIPGWLNDRHGGGVVLLGGGLLAGAGLLLFYATLVKAVPVVFGSPVVQLSLCEALRSWGNQFPSAAVMPVNMRNFDAEPALAIRVVALIKCASSLGAPIAVMLYAGFLDPNQKAFLVMAAIVVTSFNFMGAPAMKIITPLSSNAATLERDCRRIDWTFVPVGLLLVSVILYSALESSFSRGTKQVFAVCACCVWLATTSSPAFYQPPSSTDGSKKERGMGIINSNSLLLDDDSLDMASAAAGDATAGGATAGAGADGTTADDFHDDDAHSPPGTPRFTIKQFYGEKGGDRVEGGGGGDRVEMPITDAIRTIDLWLIIWCTFATTGAHSIVQINIAQVCESYGMRSKNNAAINMMLVGAAAGRVGISVAIEGLRLYQRPRVLSFAVASGLEMLAMLLLATATTSGLLVGVFLSGFCYGAYWVCTRRTNKQIAYSIYHPLVAVFLPMVAMRQCRPPPGRSNLLSALLPPPLCLVYSSPFVANRFPDNPTYHHSGSIRPCQPRC